MVGSQPDNGNLVAGFERRVGKRGLANRRVADQGRVIGDHRHVVQRMDELDASRDFYRARESNPDVAHRDRHGVAVDNDPAALGVDDQAGAVVVPVRHTGNRVGHAVVDENERRHDLLDVRLPLGREARLLRSRTRHL